jgi:hypothetical protein
MNTATRVMIGALGMAAGMMLAGAAAGQTVVAGPAFNSNTGSRYYLLLGGTYQQMRTKAEAMGGHLVRIDSLGENTWVGATFGVQSGQKMFIGLSDDATEGTFAWHGSGGGDTGYRNWASGEPNNSASRDFVVLNVADAGRWSVETAGYVGFGVVEVAGPVRVPGELSFTGAVDAVERGFGTSTIRLAPGGHGIGRTTLIPLSGYRVGTIEGAGIGETTVFTGPEVMFDVRGWWRFENFTASRQDGLPVFSTEGSNQTAARIEIEGVEFDGLYHDFPSILVKNGASVRVDGCRFENDKLAIDLAPTGREISVVNTVFENVWRVAQGTGFASFTNCTIKGARAIAFAFSNGNVRVSNTAIGALNAPGLTNGLPFYQFASCVVPEAVPGPGNIVGNPGLGADLRPVAGSACIDAGSAGLYIGGLTDLDGAARVQRAGIDIGAFEAEPAPDPVCAPDYNGDGFVDFFDYDAFVADFESGC